MEGRGVFRGSRYRFVGWSIEEIDLTSPNRFGTRREWRGSAGGQRRWRVKRHVYHRPARFFGHKTQQGIRRQRFVYRFGYCFYDGFLIGFRSKPGTFSGIACLSMTSEQCAEIGNRLVRAHFGSEFRQQIATARTLERTEAARFFPVEQSCGLLLEADQFDSLVLHQTRVVGVENSALSLLNKPPRPARCLPDHIQGIIHLEEDDGRKIEQIQPRLDKAGIADQRIDPTLHLAVEQFLPAIRLYAALEDERLAAWDVLLEQFFQTRLYITASCLTAKYGYAASLCQFIAHGVDEPLFFGVQAVFI